MYTKSYNRREGKMPTIEFLLLANHAEAVNGLLYLSGACWTDQWRGDIPPGSPPPQTPMAIGASILVPWTETNRSHRFTITIESEDGRQVAQVGGDLEVGRPPGIPSGSDQRAVLAVNASLQFPRPGGYRLVGNVGEDTRTVSFRVNDRPNPQG